jgi:hypothetical protein
LYPFTPAVTGYKVGDWVKLRIKPRLATNIRRGEVVCIDKVQDDYLRFVNPNLNPALVLWAEPKLSHKKTQRAIAPAAKNHIEEESDQNPILTGIPLSDRFVLAIPRHSRDYPLPI